MLTIKKERLKTCGVGEFGEWEKCIIFVPRQLNKRRYEKEIIADPGGLVWRDSGC